jgi:hypothetical protein
MRLLASLLFALFVTQAIAQSGGGFVQGQTLNAADLNNAFAKKQDFPIPPIITTNGITITVNPYTPPVIFPDSQAFGINETVTGTCTTTNNNCYYNFINIPSDNAVVGSGTSGTWVSGIGLYENWSFGGAAMTGQRIGMAINTVLNATTGNTAGGVSYSALSAIAVGNANDNGTSTSLANSRGQISTVNFIARLGATGTNYRALQGGEVDISIPTGGSVYEKVGWQITQLATDLVQGGTYDAALVITNQSGAVGWTNSILFGGVQGVWPMATTGTMITCAGACGTADTFIDMSSATFTTNFLKSNGFSVDGNGLLTTGKVGGSSGRIVFNGTTSGTSQIVANATGALVLSNNVTGQLAIFNDGVNGTMFSVNGGGGTIAARLQVTAATTGNPTQLAAIGTDTDITIQLTPKGAGNVKATTSLQTGVTVVGSLPSCVAGLKGARYFVTDSNSVTFHATVATGGANNVAVVCDGTNWYID